MKYIGIDYGSKRIGIAFSDDGSKVSFPFSTEENASKGGVSVVERIANLCKEKKVEAIVMGDSKDFTGEVNKIMVSAKKFASELQKLLGFSESQVHFFAEFLTSHQASKTLYELGNMGTYSGIGGKENKEREKGERREARNSGNVIKVGVDASAAAIILQGYLDSLKTAGGE